MVRKGYVCLNTDGAGFNENRTLSDMKMMSEVITQTVREGSERIEAYLELSEAVEKYLECLKVRGVKVLKFKNTVE